MIDGHELGWRHWYLCSTRLRINQIQLTPCLDNSRQAGLPSAIKIVYTAPWHLSTIQTDMSLAGIGMKSGVSLLPVHGFGTDDQFPCVVPTLNWTGWIQTTDEDVLVQRCSYGGALPGTVVYSGPCTSTTNRLTYLLTRPTINNCASKIRTILVPHIHIPMHYYKCVQFNALSAARLCTELGLLIMSCQHIKFMTWRGLTPDEYLNEKVHIQCTYRIRNILRRLDL